MNSKVKIIITSLVVLVIVAAVVVGIVLNNNSTEASSENNETDNDIDVNEDMPEENENETNEDENENEDETNSEENEDGVPFGLTKEELEKELEAIENNEQRYVIQEDKENRIRELKILLGEEANTFDDFELFYLEDELRNIYDGKSEFDTEEEKEKRKNELLALLDMTFEEFEEKLKELRTVDSDDEYDDLNMREKYQLIKDNLTEENIAYSQEIENNGYRPLLFESIENAILKWTAQGYSDIPKPDELEKITIVEETLFVTDYIGNPRSHLSSSTSDNSENELFNYFVILELEFSDGTSEELFIENLGQKMDVSGRIYTTLYNAVGQTDMKDWYFDTTRGRTKPQDYILTDWFEENN